LTNGNCHYLSFLLPRIWGNFILMNSIKDWLNNGREYHLGVALYEVYGNDDNLKDMFQQGHSPYRQTRLEKELRALKDHVKPIAQPVASEPIHVQVAVSQEVLPENKVPKEKDPYRDKWIKEYMEMNFLRHQLGTTYLEGARGKMAHKILKLEQHCMRWWAARDFYSRTGRHIEMDEPTEQTVTDPNALQQQLNNKRSNRSKYKNKLAKDPENPKLQQEFANLDAAVKSLEKQLGK